MNWYLPKVVFIIMTLALELHKLRQSRVQLGDFAKKNQNRVECHNFESPTFTCQKRKTTCFRSPTSQVDKNKFNPCAITGEKFKNYSLHVSIYMHDDIEDYK